jgi:hypothetical protein
MVHYQYGRVFFGSIDGVVSMWQLSTGNDVKNKHVESFNMPTETKILQMSCLPIDDN